MATARKTPSRTTSKKLPLPVRNGEPVWPKDEATDYALAVVRGEEMAGPYVRDACKRHLDDLQKGHERGLVWSVAHVERVLSFFRRILKLNGGDFEGQPFNPLPWQAFILGSVFGWLRVEDGVPRFDSVILPKYTMEKLLEEGLYRRFRVAYQETGKGSGKSPLAAGIGLYMLIADGEERAEVYAAATKKDQAMILFRDAVAMVQQSPALAGRIKQSGKAPNVWNLMFPTTNSFFRPIAADQGQSGPRPHLALIDELHEHPNGAIIEFLRAGFKFRKQPLLFAITNSGADKTSVCYDYHEYGRKVCAGELVDDTMFAYICGHDRLADGSMEDPFKDESIWKKSNPSLGLTFKNEYLRDQVVQARSMPSKESTVRRLNFCQWTEAYNPWLSSDIWARNAAAPRPMSHFRGGVCFAGLDLSMKNDLSALVLLFPDYGDMVTFTVKDKDGKDVPRSYPRLHVHPFFWAPEEGIVEKEKKDRVPYTAWARAGHITLVPGPVIDYAFIAWQIKEVMDEHDLRCLMFDRWRIQDLLRELKAIGVEYYDEAESPFQPHGQGFKDMSPSIELTEDMLSRGTLRHGDHPVLKWCVSNAVVVKDPAELRKFDKAKATGRIDGAVALVEACRATQGGDQEAGDLDDFLKNPIILG